MKIRIQYKIFFLFVLIIAPLIGAIYLGINKLFIDNFTAYLNSRVERSVEIVESALDNMQSINIQFIKAFGTIAELNRALENQEILIFPYILEKYRPDYGFDCLQLYAANGEIQAEAGKSFQFESPGFLKSFGKTGAFSGIVERSGKVFFLASAYSMNKQSAVVGKTLLNDTIADRLSKMIDAHILIYSGSNLIASSLINSPEGANFIENAEGLGIRFDTVTNRMIRHNEVTGLSVALFPLRDYQNKVIGTVVLGTSSAWLLASQKQQQGLIFQIIIVGIVFAMILAFIFARGITNPLRKMTFWADKVSEGDLDYTVEIRANDEVRDLSRAFSMMIGNLKQSFDKINKQNIELKKLDQLKSDLISNVSHELRTPITTIFGSVEFLLSGEIEGDPESVREFYGSIFNDIRVLKKIVDNFIMVSVIDKDEYYIKKIDLKSFLTDIREQMAGIELTAWSDERGVKVEIPALKTLGKKSVTLETDETYLRHILFELMHNAIIYNKENGSVKLDVEIGDKDLSFIVEDTGIGMMKGESAKIFDRFYRIESERTYSVSGIGLGLAVVKMICDRLKIKITVESEIGKGTVMKISGIKYSD